MAFSLSFMLIGFSLSELPREAFRHLLASQIDLLTKIFFSFSTSPLIQ